MSRLIPDSPVGINSPDNSYLMHVISKLITLTKLINKHIAQQQSKHVI